MHEWFNGDCIRHWWSVLAAYCYAAIVIDIITGFVRLSVQVFVCLLVRLILCPVRVFILENGKASKTQSQCERYL